MKWVDINDRKPDPWIPVLAYSEGAERIYIAYMPNESDYNEHWVICEEMCCSCTGLTAPIDFWMPMPDKPLGVLAMECEKNILNKIFDNQVTILVWINKIQKTLDELDLPKNACAEQIERRKKIAELELELEILRNIKN